MGKSVGFIGNFKGKLGNAVGYKVSQSNSGTNQGVRVYQPNIKNPKSAAQAEQRAKYAPIFATYRALKMIIDRGNESKQYGNASRVAWLKWAFNAQKYPWIEKGAAVNYPVLCQLTLGTLKGIPFGCAADELLIAMPIDHSETQINNVGQLSSCLIANYPYLKNGDQITIVICLVMLDTLQFDTISYILDEDDTTPVLNWSIYQEQMVYHADDGISSAAIIVSREGAKGEHLRSKIGRAHV